MPTVDPIAPESHYFSIGRARALWHIPTFKSIRAIVCIGSAAILVGCVAIVSLTDDVAAQERRANKVVKLNDGEIRAAAIAIQPLHSKIDKPGASDWLAHHKEAGQTFAQYRQRHQQRICDQFQTMYIQPLGEFTVTQKKLLAETGEFLGCFYGMPVKTLEVINLDRLPDKAQRVVDKDAAPQILTHYLLDDVLKSRRPKDAVAVLGLTASDLWPGEGWTYVFGMASVADRVGVWSIHRLGDPDDGKDAYKLCLTRTLKIASHETGHMLGIDHCVAWKCGMNGTNSMSETDRQPLEFCPECQSKLWWTCGEDPVPRYRKLLEFAESRGMEAETDYWRKAIERLDLAKTR